MGDIGMIKGGGLPGCSDKKKGRRRHSRSQGHQQRSRGLPERRGGRNNKYRENKCNTKHDKAKSSARGVLTWHYTLPAKGGASGNVSPKFGIFRHTNRRAKVACSLC